MIIILNAIHLFDMKYIYWHTVDQNVAKYGFNNLEGGKKSKPESFYDMNTIKNMEQKYTQERQDIKINEPYISAFLGT